MNTRLGKVFLEEILGEQAPATCRTLIKKVSSFDDHLGESVRKIPFFLTEQKESMAALFQGKGIPDWESLAELLYREGGRLSGDERSAFEVVLLRALAPLSALVTVPPAQLFTQEELKKLHEIEVDAGSPPPVNLLQSPGKAMNYRGYLCVILKVTRLCNLRCVYCHDWSDSKETTMSYDQLLRVIQQALSGNRSAVDFVLHGGEPLMMGRKRFIRYLALQSYLARPNQKVRNHIQSNGTMLDKKWLSLLKLFNIKVSISLDATAEIHKHSRPFASGEQSWERARASVERAREEGLLSGVLMVVTQAVLNMGAKELYRRLQSENILSICLLAERPGFGMETGIQQKDYVEFLAAFAKERSRSPKPWIGVREIDAISALLQAKPSGFCELAGSCVGSFVTVEANGDVAHCDKYVGDPAFIAGNLNDQSLDEILMGEPMSRIASRSYTGCEGYSECKYQGLCQGWCPHERYVNDDSRSSNCCGLSPLFETMESLMTLRMGEK